MTMVCDNESVLELCQNCTQFSTSVATVGLEMTVYEVTEGESSVEVCAVVFTPGGNCPIQYPFDVSLSFSDGSAGKFFIP